jgi:hypothetical protein
MSPSSRAALLLVPLVVLAGCASGGAAAAGDIQRADDDLQVEIDRGNGSPAERYTLTCLGSVEGDLPGAEAACTHLRGMADPFAPPSTDVACTEQYGGPQTARVTGLWGGRPVDLALSRTDGCRISQWDALGPLLPGPVG